MANVSVDANKCIGCGACASVAPEIFKMENGKAVVIKSELSDEEANKAKTAASGCPAQAITVS